jgi:conjugative transposon TraN protein
MRKYITLLLYIYISVSSFAQKLNKVEPVRLCASYDKSLHLIFDSSVKYVDAGSNDIVANITPGINNIVRVKVNNENYVGTAGLSVITSDGVFHSFEIEYRKDVDYTTYYANKKDSSVITNINVAYDKSTHLIFPEKIRYYDVGNEESLSAENITSKNVLKIKSKNEWNVLPSSLFVVTEDKKYYEFSLNSLSADDTYTYNFCDNKTSVMFESSTNDIQLTKIAEQCLKIKRKITTVGKKKNKVECYLNNVMINDDVLYFTFSITNRSNIDLNIDFVKCFIIDKKTLKDEAQQEQEMIPVLSYNYQNVISAMSENSFCLCFPKFTIPDEKKFIVELYDKDGGRHITFPIKSKLIINTNKI